MVRINEIKNIFLSASIPLPERDAKYIDTADIIAIRDAVIALTTVVLPHHRLIWGGHPSITPLIYFVMEKIIKNKVEKDVENFNKLTKKEQKEIYDERIKGEISEHVVLYQSQYFEKFFPEDNNRFNNIIITDIIDGDREKSLLHMRESMLSKNEFSAAVFIGGMEGVELEYKMFRDLHPKALILPIASTGAATKIVFDNLPDEDEAKHERYLKDYGYMSLFQKYLIDKI